MTADAAIIGVDNESAPAACDRPGADTGRLVPMPAQRTTVEDRFWAKVNKDGPGGCWLWTGTTRVEGYGTFWNGERQQPAHRFSYELLVGPIPEGLTIDHLCRVTGCVNPDHLEPVTSRENTRRGLVGVLKETCAQGHPWTPENIGFKSGFRYCQVCSREQSRRIYHRDKAKRMAELTPRQEAALAALHAATKNYPTDHSPGHLPPRRSVWLLFRDGLIPDAGWGPTFAALMRRGLVDGCTQFDNGTHNPMTYWLTDAGRAVLDAVSSHRDDEAREDGITLETHAGAITWRQQPTESEVYARAVSDVVEFLKAEYGIRLAERVEKWAADRKAGT